MADDKQTQSPSYFQQVKQNVTNEVDKQTKSADSTSDKKKAVDKNKNATNQQKVQATLISAGESTKQAYDVVTGAINTASTAVLMPAMQALSAFKGTAILPIAKQLDPVLGIDVHFVNMPTPMIPMPHPYIGIIMDPQDWIAMAALSILATATPEDAPEINEDSSKEDVSKANTQNAKSFMYSVAQMGLAMIGATVKIGEFIPRGVTGTKTKNFPHIPMGAGFSPVPMLKNHGHVQFGSLFVVADGDPLSGLMMLNNDCWDIGMPALFRKKRPQGPPPFNLYMPTGIVLPIPWNRPILVNPVPTPINPLSIADKLFKAGFGKLLRKVKNKFKKKPDEAAAAPAHAAPAAAPKPKRNKSNRKKSNKKKNKQRSKKKNRNNNKKKNTVRRLKNRGKNRRQRQNKNRCTSAGHPVDVATGVFFTDSIDFSLPGPIPLQWEREYSTDSVYQGPLGHGWHHRYDLALSVDVEEDEAALRLQDGRIAEFDELPEAEDDFSFNRSEKLYLYRKGTGYVVKDTTGLSYHFETPCAAKEDVFLLAAVENSGGYRIVFQYNDEGQLLALIDSAGRLIKMALDAQGRILKILAPHPSQPGETITVASYVYDHKGDMVKQTDALGQSMYFEYRNHLMVRETWRNGLNWYFEYDGDDEEARCIHTWGDGGVLDTRLQYAETYTIVTDSFGNVVTHVHRDGLVIKTTDAREAVWTYRYNEFCELEWETDPLGNQHGWTYDEFGNIVTDVNPDGGFISFEYFVPDLPWLPSEAKDANGGRWRWIFDDNGEMVEKKDPRGAITKYDYENGLLVRVTDALERRKEMFYDQHANLVRYADEAGSVTHYRYDRLGNCIEVTNAFGKTQFREYDLKGRVLRIHDFDDNDIQLTYDAMGNIASYRDKKREIAFVHDGLSNLVKRTERNAVLQFSYDAESRLSKVLNEYGDTYTFDRDSAGNVIRETSFNGITNHFVRNEVGWVTEVKRPDKKTTRYEHDAMGRITQTSYSDGEKELLTYNAAGQLTGAVNSQGKLELERNVMGDVEKESWEGDVVSSAYDILSRRIGISSSLGASIQLELDLRDNTAAILAAANGQLWESRVQYNALGLEVARELPGMVVQKREWDAAGRPLLQKIERTSGRQNRVAQQRRYMWDVNDQLKEISDSVTGTSRFEYDKWGNLSKTIYGDGSVQWRTPDKAGNLFESEMQRDRQYTRGGRLLESKDAMFSYDEEGNLVRKEEKNGRIWLYHWNDNQTLKSVVRPDGDIVSFGYDALGRRVWKQYKNTITRWRWDGNVPLHEWKEHAVTGDILGDAVVNEAGELQDRITTWVFEKNGLVPAAKLRGSRKYSILADHLGTPNVMLDEDGNTVWRGELDSYGRMRMERGEAGSCQFRYQGQYEDAETGLSYNRFRYYAPEEGMYISPDPIGLMGGFALYSYVANPNAWVDMFGMAGCKTGKGEYKDVGGHHVHAKAGFKNNVNYDPKKGFSISQDYMNQRGWSHQDMTNKQRELFNELANSGRANTIYEHNRIAVEALQAGGATRAEARSLVAESLRNLRSQGALNPSNIPWN